jgi:hypothetical protein
VGGGGGGLPNLAGAGGLPGANSNHRQCVWCVKREIADSPAERGFVLISMPSSGAPSTTLCILNIFRFFIQSRHNQNTNHRAVEYISTTIYQSSHLPTERERYRGWREKDRERGERYRGRKNTQKIINFKTEWSLIATGEAILLRPII